MLFPNGSPPGIGMELDAESSILDGSVVLFPSAERNGISLRSIMMNFDISYMPLRITVNS